jgi:hypothetical protein
MIEKAGVLVPDKGSVPENLAEGGRIFQSCGTNASKSLVVLRGLTDVRIV